MTKNVVLVTGGAGFIGSHTVIELLNSDYDVVVVDNLVNSSEESLRRVEQIAGKKILAFYPVDITHESALEEVFKKHSFHSVVHFAGLKAVGESVAKPIEYFQNNVGGTLTLLKLMRSYKVKNLVFSSSATVYGDIKEVPSGGLHEDQPTLPATNPYGRSKFFIEEILKDTYRSDNTFNFVLLRYFNPVGAHPSGLIGEDPKDIPNNLMPYITQVAIGKLPCLSVFGSDYPTKDGTGVRDYIHVVDLAQGHIAAVRYLDKKQGVSIFNLGTGNGVSVLEMVTAMRKASGKEIPYKLVARRPGDIAECYASPEKAKTELGWSAKYQVDEMCRDAWNWQSKNPDGYSKL